LHAVPPTREAFIENVKRAIFRQFYGEILVLLLSSLNPEDFGWEKIINKSFCSTALPENSKPGPDFIL